MGKDNKMEYSPEVEEYIPFHKARRLQVLEKVRQIATNSPSKIRTERPRKVTIYTKDYMQKLITAAESYGKRVRFYDDVMFEKLCPGFDFSKEKTDPSVDVTDHHKSESQDSRASNTIVEDFASKSGVTVTPVALTEVFSKSVLEVIPEPVIKITAIADVAFMPFTEITTKPVAEVAPMPLVQVAPKPIVDVTSKPFTEVTPKPITETEVTCTPVADVILDNSKLVAEVNLNATPEPMSNVSKNAAKVTSSINNNVNDIPDPMNYWTEFPSIHMLEIISALQPKTPIAKTEELSQSDTVDGSAKTEAQVARPEKISKAFFAKAEPQKSIIEASSSQVAVDKSVPIIMQKEGEVPEMNYWWDVPTYSFDMNDIISAFPAPAKKTEAVEARRGEEEISFVNYWADYPSYFNVLEHMKPVQLV